MKVMSHFFLNPVVYRVWLIAIFFAMAFSLTIGAQEISTSVTDQLKDIKRSGESCRKGEQVPLPKGVAQRKDFQADLSCAMSAQEMLLWVKAGQLTIVDTRTADEYQKYHIDGSLNLASGNVGHKTQFRNSSIALVGTGRLEKELYVACAKLKAEGFKSVQVLQGGLPSWLNVQQRREAGATSVAHLDAAELFAEAQFDANLIVISPSESAMQRDLAYAVVLPQDSVEGFKKLIETQRRDPKARLINAVIWVTSPQTKPELLDQLREVAAPTPFLVYSEGGAAYQRYVKEQKAVWLAYTRGPKQPTCGL